MPRSEAEQTLPNRRARALQHLMRRPRAHAIGQMDRARRGRKRVRPDLPQRHQADRADPEQQLAIDARRARRRVATAVMSAGSASGHSVIALTADFTCGQ